MIALPTNPKMDITAWTISIMTKNDIGYFLSFGNMSSGMLFLGELFIQTVDCHLSFLVETKEEKEAVFEGEQQSWIMNTHNGNRWMITQPKN